MPSVRPFRWLGWTRWLTSFQNHRELQNIFFKLPTSVNDCSPETDTGSTLEGCVWLAKKSRLSFISNRR
jgi:hypothetical protein